MPTILVSILKFITHPSTLIAILAAGVVWFSMHTLQDNKDLKDLVGEQKASISQLQHSMDIQKEDLKSLGKLMDKNMKVRQREADINKVFAEIPKTSTDRPFSNPDLLNAAGVLREYQTNEQSTTTGPDN